MAEETKDKQGSDQVSTRTRASADQSPDTFEVSDLIARSADFLGQPSFVVAAALHGQTKALTIDAASARVDSWLKKPVTEEA